MCDLERATIYGSEFSDALDTQHLVDAPAYQLEAHGEERSHLIICPISHRAVHGRKSFLSPTLLRPRQAAQPPGSP